MSVPVLADACRILTSAPLLAVTVMRDNSCKVDIVDGEAVVLAYRLVVLLLLVVPPVFHKQKEGSCVKVRIPNVDDVDKEEDSPVLGERVTKPCAERTKEVVVRTLRSDLFHSILSQVASVKQ